MTVGMKKSQFTYNAMMSTITRLFGNEIN